MSDEGLDPCECIWNHELAMRRLLSLLRQGQAYCTNSECLEELPGLGAPTQTADNFILMSIIMFLGMMLYAFRPRRTETVALDEKPFDSQGPSGQPPPPSATN